MDTSRGSVPATFAPDACVEQSAIWLRDQLSVPVHLKASGDTAEPVDVTVDNGIAAWATRSHFHDPLLLLPHDVLRVPIGPGAASVTVTDTDAGGYYVLATTVAAFTPAGAAKDVYDAFTGLITELFDVFTQYRTCLQGKNWLGQVGCEVLRERNVWSALGRASVSIVLAAGAGVVEKVGLLLLNTATYLKFIGSQTPDVGTILRSTRTLALAAQAGDRSAGPSPAAATVVLKVRPIDSQGHVAPGYQVSSTSTAGATCTAGSEYVGRAYRCFGEDHFIHDPCWKEERGAGRQPAVLCPMYPWTTAVVRLLLTQALDPPAGTATNPATEPPWGVQLSTGERCFELGGAHDSYQTRAVDYACTTGSRVLLRGMDRKRPVWTFRSAYYRNGYSPGPVVQVATAWYGLPGR